MTSSPDPRITGHYYEDLVVGRLYESDGFAITQGAVISFAAEWDPQSFHLDIVAARNSIFGTLVGSGLQSLMVAYRLYHQLGLLDGTALAGLGIDAVRFRAPLRPGDTVRVRVSTAKLKPTSRPERGVVRWDIALLNQENELILTFSLTALVARRPARKEWTEPDLVHSPS